MKIHLFAALVAATSALSLAPAANAQTTTSTPPPSSCTGNACPGTQSFTVGGTSFFGGGGLSEFKGQNGTNLIEKMGSGGVNIEIKAGGGLCGIDCADGAFKFEGFAREQVTVKTAASGSQTGIPVTAMNQGIAQGAVNFQVVKLTNPE